MLEKYERSRSEGHEVIYNFNLLARYDGNCGCQRFFLLTQSCTSRFLRVLGGEKSRNGQSSLEVRILLIITLHKEVDSQIKICGSAIKRMREKIK